MPFLSDEQAGAGELDALRAAPGYHTLLFENESVRVHIQRWSDCVRRDEEGAVLMDTRISGGPEEESTLWSGSLGPHTLENVGGAELRVLCVEIKSGHC